MDNSSEGKKRLLKISRGKGIQYILDEAYKILGNPILTHDMQYRLIASNKNVVTDDPVWNEYMENGMAGKDWQIFFRDEFFLEMAANAKKVTLLPSDKLKYDRIYGKLFTKNNMMVGCACMPACFKPFDDSTPELFETVCDILNRELYGSKRFQQYSQSCLEELIIRLIEDSLDDKSHYISHIESVYSGTKTFFHLAIVDIPGHDKTTGGIERFRNLFIKARPDFKYAVYSNHILILINSDDADLHIKKDLRRLSGLFKRHAARVGISGGFENILELPKRYAQAAEALDYELYGSDDQHIFRYSDLPQACAEYD